MIRLVPKTDVGEVRLRNKGQRDDEQQAREKGHPRELGHHVDSPVLAQSIEGDSRTLSDQGAVLHGGSVPAQVAALFGMGRINAGDQFENLGSARGVLRAEIIEIRIFRLGLITRSRCSLMTFILFPGDASPGYRQACPKPHERQQEADDRSYSSPELGPGINASIAVSGLAGATILPWLAP